MKKINYFPNFSNIRTKDIVDELLDRLLNEDNKIKSLELSKRGLIITFKDVEEKEFYNFSNLNKATWIFNELDNIN